MFVVTSMVLLGGLFTMYLKRTPKPKEIALVEMLIDGEAKTGVVVTPQPAVTFKEIQQHLTQLFTDDRRRQQLQALGATEDAYGSNPVEQQARQDFHLATVGLGCAIVGLALPPVMLLSAAPLGYIFLRSSLKRAWLGLVQERRLNIDARTVLWAAGAMAGNLLFPAALGAWFYTIVVWLAAKTETQAKRQLVNLFGQQPRTVWRLAAGVEVETPFTEIQIDDIVVVTAGNVIPVDGVITTGHALIDQHALTGEAQPVEKAVGDPVYTATLLLAGHIHIQVTKTGQQTVAAQVGEILQQTSDFKRSLQSEAETMLDRLTLPMVLLSAVVWPLLGIQAAVTVLGDIPGFRMMLLGPMTMLSFLNAAAQKGILIKDGCSLERLATIDTMVFDKTGTLTLTSPQIANIHSYNGLSQRDLLMLAAAAEYKQTHPIAQAILTAAQHHQLALPVIDDAHYEIGHGIKVQVGAQTIRVGSRRYLTNEGIVLPETILAHQARCANYGHSMVMVAVDQHLAGAIELRPTLRPEAKAVIAHLKQRGLAIYVISGDNDAPTRRLAEELDIDYYAAEVLPEDKALLVGQLQAAGRKVCFVGDGINDAIALQKADVSISMSGATAIATDTAQIVLMDGTLQNLEYLLDFTHEFAAAMRLNLLAATVPPLVGLGGTLLLGWGMLTSILLIQVSGFAALYNLIRPVLATGRQVALQQRYALATEGTIPTYQIDVTSVQPATMTTMAISTAQLHEAATINGLFTLVEAPTPVFV